MGARNDARRGMAKRPHFPAHLRAYNPKTHKHRQKNWMQTEKKKTILATGSEVRGQVLLPAAEKQAWRGKEVGRFNGAAWDLG